MMSRILLVLSYILAIICYIIPSGIHGQIFKSYISRRVKALPNQFEEIRTLQLKSFIKCKICCIVDPKCGAFSIHEEANKTVACKLIKMYEGGSTYTPDESERLFKLCKDQNQESTENASTSPSTESSLQPATSPSNSSDFCSSNCQASATLLLDNMVVMCSNNENVYTLDNEDMCNTLKCTTLSKGFQNYTGKLVEAAVNIGNSVALLIDTSGSWYFYMQDWNIGLMAIQTTFCVPTALQNKKFNLATRVNGNQLLFMEYNGVSHCIDQAVFQCGSTYQEYVNNTACGSVASKIASSGAVAVDQSNQAILSFDGNVRKILIKNWEIN